MPLKCCIDGCNNSLWKRKTENNKNTLETYPKTKDISFHAFPKNNERNQQWKNVIFYGNKQQHIGKNPRICSDHFDQNDVLKRKTNVVLDIFAVPRVFPNSDHTDYEFLYPENDENIEPNAKRMKLGSQNLKLNASTPFFAPIMSVGNVANTCANPTMPVVNDFHSSSSIGDVESVVADTCTNPTMPVVNDLHSSSSIDDVESVLIVNDDTQQTNYEAVPDICNVSINTSPMLPENIAHSTPKSRKIRYPGDINEEEDMTPNTARKNIRFCKRKIKLQAKEIYKLKKTVKRQKKRIETLKELLRKLKAQYGLSGQAVQSIESTFEDDIIEQLKEGRKTKSYSDNVKSFALTLHFYSSAAYQYIRLGYKFSQDHLETMFAVIRSKGGFNNNPNVLQFKSAFKRLLMRNQLTSSLNANCLNTAENFLYFERLTKATAKNSSCKETQFYDDVQEVWEDAFDETNTFKLTEYAVDVVTYIAGFVERTLKKRLKCENCINAVSKKTIFTSKLIKIKNRGGLTVPQFDVFTVCRTAEKILWSTDISRIDFYEKLYCRIMRQFVDKPVFRDMGHSSIAIECEHSLSLLKTVVSIYLKVRLHHIAKHHNINSKTKFVRSKCTKLVHFSHQ